MNLKAFSIFDSKAKFYGSPFFANSTGLAVRMFTDLVNDPKSTVSRYPLDFSLFEIGSFDDALGALVPLSSHVPLGIASNFKTEASI